jgi:hypothetical protein
VFVRKLIVFLFLCTGLAHATNWYVRSSSAGSKSGADWNNAWSLSSINWSSVNPGDTIWLAGGNYSLSSSVAPTKGGNSTSGPIAIRRVLSTDSVPVAASGWNSSFDSQVVITPTTATVFSLTYPYLTVDGRVGVHDGSVTPYGIKINYIAGYTGATDIESTNDTVQYIEENGPGLDYFEKTTGSVTCTFGVTIGWNNGTLTGSSLNHNYIHDSDTLLDGNGDGIVIEYNFLTRSGGNGGGCHGNVFYMGGTDTVGGILRYNEISQWDDEGIFMTPYPANSGGATNWKIYGNVFHDGHHNPYVSNYPMAICFRSNFSGSGFEIYNNTFAVTTNGDGISNNDSTATCTGCSIRNNLAYQSGIDAIGTQSNNTNDNTNRFVSVSSQNYHLAQDTAAGYSLGTALPTGCTAGVNCYNIDPDGTLRGVDGVWDQGAYQLGGASNQPGAPTALQFQVK